MLVPGEGQPNPVPIVAFADKSGSYSCVPPVYLGDLRAEAPRAKGPPPTPAEAPGAALREVHPARRSFPIQPEADSIVTLPGTTLDRNPCDSQKKSTIARGFVALMAIDLGASAHGVRALTCRQDPEALRKTWPKESIFSFGNGLVIRT